MIHSLVWFGFILRTILMYKRDLFKVKKSKLSDDSDKKLNSVTISVISLDRNKIIM